MILVIQSNLPGQIFVWLLSTGGIITDSLQRTIGPGGSEILLTEVQRLLKRNKTSIKRLTGIIVITGPGPFTPVRTGLVVANTLADVLKIQVFGIASEVVMTKTELAAIVRKLIKTSVGVYPKPFYGREPNISRAKRKPFLVQRSADRGRGRIVAK